MPNENTMPDREEIIKGLKTAYQQYTRVEGQGILVDHAGNEYALIDPTLMKATLKLLKAQEAVEPIQDMVGDALFWVCGKCGEDIMSTSQYCSKCGRKVKWE